ncbi:MAG: [FeFe] hydrogenase H-cluster radical SAM maturase HydE [Clostridia bacterium]|nr:[FeFe] hydrogenase H-cluster radical SAM maturase HydE [Clostridia bacterium]
MNDKLIQLTKKLIKNRTLTEEEYAYIVAHRSNESATLLRQAADNVRREYYGTDVYIRGLIEISNICKNNCLYCGIRAGNKNCQRYRLTVQQILGCCDEGYSLGFRTFVLQGGEDGFFTDEILCEVIAEIKRRYPDCAVTLSLGERSRESYQRLFDAGADRYLLRHETADDEHYSLLHPSDMTLANRMKCLEILKDIGYQVGCGFMVGSPYQTDETIAKDLKFIENFQPDMCGIGPFIPHKDTPFADYEQGTLELTCYLLSIVRLICPRVLLPATTALGTIDPQGREKGVLSGANVVMPNLSPEDVRDKYSLYNGKLSSGAEAASNKAELARRMKNIGYRVVSSRGDVNK